MSNSKNHDIMILIREKFKVWLDEYKQFLWYCFIVLLISFVFLFISDYHYNTFDLISAGKSSPKHYYAIEAFHAIEISILTLFLIFVAWLQLKNLNKTGKADFLMRIDERFSNHDIIRARSFIHELYVLHRPINCRHSKSKSPCNNCRDEQMKKIRNSIKNIRHDIRLSKKFARLRYLLELLETMGYLANTGYIDLDDIKTLAGDSVEFYYKVYKDWIDFVQSNKDENYFSEFEKLIYQINPCLVSEDKRKKFNVS